MIRRLLSPSPDRHLAIFEDCVTLLVSLKASFDELSLLGLAKRCDFEDLAETFVRKVEVIASEEVIVHWMSKSPILCICAVWQLAERCEWDMQTFVVDEHLHQRNLLNLLCTVLLSDSEWLELDISLCLVSREVDDITSTEDCADIDWAETFEVRQILLCPVVWLVAGLNRKRWFHKINGLNG